MNESVSEVVLIDDNSDNEGSVTEVESQPVNGMSEIKPPGDNDGEEFRVCLKRFLESCCNVVDLINLDSDSEDEKRIHSKCLNTYCMSGEDVQVAPDFVKSHYGLLKSKNQQVCRQCYNDAVSSFKDLAERIEKNIPAFLAKFPKCSQVVLIDSDDEEEVLNKDEPLSVGDIDVLTMNFEACFNTFFQKYNLHFQEKKADELLNNKLTDLENSFAVMRKDLLSTEKTLMGCMGDLYDAYFPKTKEVGKTDIPFEEMRPLHLKPIDLVDDTFSSTENDIIMIHEASVPNNAKPLPPIGDLIRVKPNAGDRVYVMKVSTFSEWVPARIEEVLQKHTETGKIRETYRVKIESGKQSSYQKEVVAGYMAYWDPPACRLPLGTRIISLSTASHRMPKKFFSGITAEYLSNSNLQRYLVFFDDGYAQYAQHDDVRVVCESKVDVSDYFRPGSHKFIRHYLDNFPERPMLKVRLMDTIKTEYGGHWYNARVKNVDCALVQMLFLKDFRSEWIYRGSTRLFPLYAELKMRKDLRHRNTLRKNRPVVHYSDGIETNSDGFCSESVIEISQPRAVARKSSARSMLTSTWDSRKSNVKQPLTLDYGAIEVLIPDGPKPKSFVKHKCAPSCISWINYEPEKLKGRNPLSIPHIVGFRRFQMVGDSEQDIVYKAPCGRVLRDQDEVLVYLYTTHSELTVELFDFKYWVNIFDEFVIPDRFIKINDLSYGREEVPIQCVNTIDSSVPTYMDYITERRGCEGVFLNLDDGFLTCCDCTDNCGDKIKCACWQKTIKGHKALGKNYNADPTSIGYRNRRLSDLVSTGIYECNQKCKCKKTCLNRVVQHPLKLKLQLFKTKKKGWGTRCLNDIPCGTFICVYVGDILTEANANEGGIRYGDEYFAELDYIEVVEALKEDYEDEVVGVVDAEEDFEEIEAEKKKIYFESDDEFEPTNVNQRQSKGGNSLGMQLRQRKSRKDDVRGDEFSSDHSEDSTSDPRQPRVPRNFEANIVDSIVEKEKPSYPSVRTYFGKDETVYIMDAKTAGNIGRYLNHSCDPNIFVQNVFVDTHDLRFPWVAFFALRYIKAGTELTWDYRYEVGSVPGKKMYCFCGAEDCRGRLL